MKKFEKIKKLLKLNILYGVGVEHRSTDTYVILNKYNGECLCGTRIAENLKKCLTAGMSERPYSVEDIEEEFIDKIIPIYYDNKILETGDGNFENQLSEMNLFDELETKNYNITKVPNGWIFTSKNQLSEIFIPFINYEQNKTKN